MENIRLDELHRVVDTLDALRNLSRDVSSFDSLPDAVKPLQTEIKSVTEAVFFYKDQQYEDVIKILADVSDHSLDKHRLMASAFLKLYEQALEQKRESANKLLDRENIMQNCTLIVLLGLTKLV
jgi:hypothetical protein